MNLGPKNHLFYGVHHSGEPPFCRFVSNTAESFSPSVTEPSPKRQLKENNLLHTLTCTDSTYRKSTTSAVWAPRDRRPQGKRVSININLQLRAHHCCCFLVCACLTTSTNTLPSSKCQGSDRKVARDTTTRRQNASSNFLYTCYCHPTAGLLRNT